MELAQVVLDTIFVTLSFFVLLKWYTWLTLKLEGKDKIKLSIERVDEALTSIRRQLGG